MKLFDKGIFQSCVDVLPVETGRLGGKCSDLQWTAMNHDNPDVILI